MQASRLGKSLRWDVGTGNWKREERKTVVGIEKTLKMKLKFEVGNTKEIIQISISKKKWKNVLC